MIKETFRRNGLEVSFQAKPIDNVAGNGEHIHIGACLKTDNGKVVNLLSPFEKDSYLNIFGYGALMGILNHYDVLSAFVSPSHDALKRLKPDFEAPVSSVCSLGVSPEMPSRNRTVLIGLVSDLENEMARRFEFRAANPHTNLYITLPAMLMSMLDGISYAVESEKSEQELLEELSKQPGEFLGYLKEPYAFRAEKNIFTDYTDEEREKLFGKAPKTVYDVINALKETNGDNDYLKKVFNEQFVDSYCDYMLDRWKKELCDRIIPIQAKEIRDNFYLCFEDEEVIKGKKVIEKLGEYLIRDKKDKKCLRSRIKEAAKDNDYELLSRLFQKFVKAHEEYKDLCQEYQDNLVY
jgi:glutamine synthetase